MSQIYNLLKKYYESRDPWIEVEEELKKAGLLSKKDDFLEPFTNLVIGILSQNTSDRNSTRAYLGLIKKFKKISPRILTKASLKEIEKAIKSGGLYRIKAKRIRDLAKIILEKYSGDLGKITKLSKNKGRKILLDLPGIGPKTADVFIGYCMKQDALPIDTNIKRVARRIGIIDESDNYTQIQQALLRILPKSKRLRGHEFLIRLGRDFCKAKSLQCDKCPIKSICKKRI